jgi:Domain of unknown function (DUF1843)
MKEVAAQSQQYLTEYGDVSAALESLKIEILPSSRPQQVNVRDA